MKSFLQYIDDSTLRFYIENVENYNEYMAFRNNKASINNNLKELISNKTENELTLLENKVVFKYLNHINWDVSFIDNTITEAATRWEMEQLKNG